MLIRDYTSRKVADYLSEKPRQVCLVFIHGLGDVVMFVEPLRKLRTLFPETVILLGLQTGVGQVEFFSEYLEGVVGITDANVPFEDCDYTFQIHFPMSESFEGKYTKAELCCEWELGIEKVCSYPYWGLKTAGAGADVMNPFVAVHFQATALPFACNPLEDVAREIWNEIRQAGFIPIESFYPHVFANPRNNKFDFITRHVRDLRPDIRQLFGMLAHCGASIGVSSGNFHLSLAALPAERVLYLKKEYDVSCYTRNKLVQQVDVVDYERGSVGRWLEELKMLKLKEQNENNN